MDDVVRPEPHIAAAGNKKSFQERASFHWRMAHPPGAESDPIKPGFGVNARSVFEIESRTELLHHGNCGESVKRARPLGGRPRRPALHSAGRILMMFNTMENQNSLTLYVAVWGAAIGSLTFIWNLLKWRRERPRLSATIEAVKSFWKEDDYACIRLTLRNRGQQRTTVEEVYLYERPLWSKLGLFGVWLRLTGDNAWNQRASVSNPETVKLPAALDGNDVWTGFIPLEASDGDNEKELRQIDRNKGLVNILHSGRLRFSVQCAHTDRCTKGVVQSVDF
jgi:hypothetical protein